MKGLFDKLPLDTPKVVLANGAPEEGDTVLDFCMVVSAATSMVLANVGLDAGATGLLDVAMLVLETLVAAAVELLAVVVVGAELLP